MKNHKFIAAFGLSLTLSVGIAAEQGGGVIRREEPPAPSRDIERSAVNFSARLGSGGTKVIGTVIDVRQVPVAGVRLQLRNLDTGNVESEADSDGEGGYEFEVEESGTYVVEMVMVDGYIVALSNAGSLARFETLQTVVQLPGRWDFASRMMVMENSVANFFGMSAETTMTATTIQIAVDQNVPPANAGAPASPTTTPS